METYCSASVIFQARAIQSSCIYNIEILLISNDRFLKQLLNCFLVLPFLERLGVIGGIRFISGLFLFIITVSIHVRAKLYFHPKVCCIYEKTFRIRLEFFPLYGYLINSKVQVKLCLALD